MECSVLLERGNIRRIVLYPRNTENSYAFSFSSIAESKHEASTCKLEMIESASLDLDNFTDLLKKPIYGCLGLLHVGSDDFLCVITAVTVVGSILDRLLYRIDRAEFVSISSSSYDGFPSFGASTRPVPQFYSDDSNYGRRAPSVHPCAEIALFLSESSFYFGYDWDATKNLQKTTLQSRPFCWDFCEPSFFWNRYLLRPIRRYTLSLSAEKKACLTTCGLFVATFEGYSEMREFQFGKQTAAFGLISRISCRRAGTRYRSRGIDDDGNVSNFVESETLFATSDYTFSYIIIRGTVPVFWDQQGFQLGFPKIQITRSPAATQPSFDRHINNLQNSYGLVHIVDLLSQKEGQAENVLSNALDFHIRKYPETGTLSQTIFDLYSVCKNQNFERLESLFHLIGRDLQVFGYFVIDRDGSLVREQKGVFRVNCLDCLDRTNIVQNYIVKRTLDLFVRNYLLGSGITYDTFIFQGVLNDLWSLNGDQLSRIYTGSNAIKSSYGRLAKFTFSSFFEDVRNTARRFYSNNFIEKNRQTAIDLFLGIAANQIPVVLFSSVPDIVEMKMSRRRSEYCDKTNLFVQVLTWNINGASPIAGEDFSPLTTSPKGYIPHIVAVGFQEIVQLNATQIISVDPERRIQWEGLVSKYLREIHEQSYSLIVAHQLVGTTISIFVRSDYLDSIRKVEIASKKTGMGGMAGNKGSVAVRLDIFNSSICFVSSHFSAGQSNFAERNKDMLFAMNELQTSGGRGILSNDSIFWFGDMNYRIDLNREKVRELIVEKSFDTLKEYDQLRLNMREGFVFKGFSEPEINFAPTYKYDLGTNIYDTSDKMRVPSWTDRILYKGEVTPILYDRAEIDVSDHKPVKGFFDVVVLKVDQVREAALRKEISESMDLLELNQFESDVDTNSEELDLMDFNDPLPVADRPPPLPDRPSRI